MINPLTALANKAAQGVLPPWLARRRRHGAASGADGQATPAFPRRRMGVRSAILLCFLAAAAVCFSTLLQSDASQDWRLARMSLPALLAELKASGENARLLYFIGLRLNQARRFAQADGYLREGVGLDRDSSRLRGEWAVALLGCGNTATAYGELREFAGTHPQLADAHYIFGKFYFSQHSMERAAEELEWTVALDPRHADAFLYLAAARDSQRDMDRAYTAASRAAALRPDDPEARLVLASLSDRARRPPDQVRAEFEKAVALNPRSAAAHQEFARWLLDTGSPSDRSLAMVHAAKAVALGVHDSTAYLVLGRAYIYKGEDATAIQPLCEAARLTPEDPGPALALWQAYTRLKQSRQSRDWQRDYLGRQRSMTEKNRLMQDVAAAPQDPRRKAALAAWMGRHGDAAECLRNYSAAMGSPSDSPSVLVAASHALVQGGHPALALPLCARAAATARHSPDAQEALGDALLALRQVESAAAAFNSAIRLDPDRSPRLIARLRAFVSAHRKEPGIRSVQIVERTTKSAR